jgi:hypothetical protein
MLLADLDNLRCLALALSLSKKSAMRLDMSLAGLDYADHDRSGQAVKKWMITKRAVVLDVCRSALERPRFKVDKT